MHEGTEIRWVIDGFTPNTIPMPRLIEYMSELMKLFGEEKALRFVRLEDNCVAVVNKSVDPVALGRVERRLKSVGSGQSAPSREAAYRRINDMLSEDRTRAYIRRGSAIILRFPGAGRQIEEPLTLQGIASVSGYLYHLSETASGEINVRVRQQGQHYARCMAPMALGSELQRLLFSPVRLTGKGTWVRSVGGMWSVTDLAVTEVIQLRNVSLREAIDELRAVKSSWVKDPLARVAQLDDGSEGGT